jgi:transposase-like protein
MLANNQAFISQTQTIVVKQEISKITICPSCYSDNIKVRTVRKGNTRYYYCRNCKRCTSKPVELSKNEEKLKVICSNCGGAKVIRKGITSNKKQRYYCCQCKRYSVSPKFIKEAMKMVEKQVCSYCQNSQLKKKGFNRLGKQVYYCFTCQKRTVKINYTSTSSFVQKMVVLTVGSVTTLDLEEQPKEIVIGDEEVLEDNKIQG